MPDRDETSIYGTGTIVALGNGVERRKRIEQWRKTKLKIQGGKSNEKIDDFGGRGSDDCDNQRFDGNRSG
jgi:hypothetical protein